MRIVLLATLLFFINTTIAQVPKPRKNTFVNDYAGVLNATDAKAINQKIYKIQKETGVQLAVVLVNEIPKAYTIKTFATQIGKKWHVGTKKRGLVYVAAIQQHQQRLAVAKNLSAVFTNEISEEILASMKDAYRNEDYNGGLNILVNKIHTTLVPASAAPVAQTKPAQQHSVIDEKKKEEDGNALVGFAFIFGVVILVVFIYQYNKRKNQKIAEANYALMQQQYRDSAGYDNYNSGGYSSGNYSSYDGGSRPHQRGRSSSGVGSFVGGAALGAAAGYGARYLQDKMNENHTSHTEDTYASTPATNSFTPEITEDNNSDNWGKWGSGDTGNDSGFSDNDNSSSYSSDDSGFSNDSSSSDDNSSDSGASSSW